MMQPKINQMNLLEQQICWPFSILIELKQSTNNSYHIQTEKYNTKCGDIQSMNLNSIVQIKRLETINFCQDMSFTIKPINAFLLKDTDMITKMNPQVYLTIGSRKYQSKSDKGEGKTPHWIDTFEVPVIMSPSELQMKVQLYDKDIIKDGFVGEGWYDLSMLLQTPGKTQSGIDNVELVYIDLIRKGEPAGRVLLEMAYNNPFRNQGPYMNQFQSQGQKVTTNKYTKGYGTKYQPFSYNYNQQQTIFYNQTNQMQQGYKKLYNSGQEYQNQKQPGMESQGQNKENIQNQGHTGGKYPETQKINLTQNYPNQPSYNNNQLGFNPNQPGRNPNQQQSSQSSGW